MNDDSDNLKYNWTPISYLAALRGAQPKEVMQAAKTAYFSQKLRPLNFPDKQGLSTLVRLILLSEIDNSVLDELRSLRESSVGSPNSIAHVDELANSILSLSCWENFTFGNNTYFNGKESAILDALAFDDKVTLTNIAKRNRKQLEGDRDIAGLVTPPRTVSRFLRKAVPAKFDVSWRDVHRWEAKMLSCPDSVRFIESDVSGEADLLAVAWISRNPDSFDPRVLQLAQKIESVYKDSNLPRRVRAYFGYVVEKKLENYVEEHHLGERFTVCVKYDSEEQLKSMIDLLDPVSRYPMISSDPSSKIRYFPIGKDGEKRASADTVLTMWGAGMVFDRIKIVGPSTLLCSPRRSAEFSFKGFSGISLDATDVGKKIEAKRQMVGDGDPWYKKRFPHVVVVGSEPDSWHVAFSNSHRRIHIMSRPVMKEFASDCITTEDIALKFATQEGNKLMKTEFKNATVRARKKGKMPSIIVNGT